MKRYALFSGADYYPSGGWKDFRGSFGSMEDAKDALIRATHDTDWAQIVDIFQARVVWEK